MASRRIVDLHIDLQGPCQEWLDWLNEVGVKVFITCTFRSEEEQNALYAQGREDLDYVNLLRKAVGLYPIDHSKNIVVTNAMGGQSPHNFEGPDNNPMALAFDFALCEKGHEWDLKADFNNDDVSDYEQAGAVAIELGLDWGGNWTSFKDYPHIQLPNWSRYL